MQGRISETHRPRICRACSSSEYDETTWSARTWLTFVRQRISVAIAYASSHEIAQALGMSVATDPRGQ